VTYVVIKLPKDSQNDFQSLWKDIRLQEGLDPSEDLSEPVESENFDGAQLVEWLISLSPSSTNIITGLFGYMVARRGEIEIERNGTRIKMKNMKISHLKDVIKALDINE